MFKILNFLSLFIMNKYDKNFKGNIILSDTKKITELFNKIYKLDTYDLLQYITINQIDLNYINNNGDSLIHEVINLDNIKYTELSKLNIIKFLVQHGINPDMPNKINKTPLHLACYFQFEKIIEYLLTLNINVNYQDDNDNTALHYLFLGNIKNLINNKTTDFIKNLSNTNNDNDNNIISNIHKNLWVLLKEEPLIDLLQKTINKFYINNEEVIIIKNKYVELLKESIDNNKNDLIINMKIDLLKLLDSKLDNNLEDIVIHQINENSWEWTPHNNINTNQLSIIKNGNGKQIRKDLETYINNIKDYNLKYTPNNALNYTFQSLSYIYSQLLNSNILKTVPAIRERPNPPLPAVPPNPPNQPFPARIEYRVVIDNFNPANINYDDYRHTFALDNASDIINIKTLKYMGGPRTEHIVYPPYELARYNSDTHQFEYRYIEIWYEYIKIKQLSIEKKILYMLCIPVNFNNIFKIDNITFDIFNLIHQPILIGAFNNNIGINGTQDIHDIRNDFVNPQLMFTLDLILNLVGQPQYSTGGPVAVMGHPNYFHNIHNMAIPLYNLPNNLNSGDYEDIIVYIYFSYYAILQPDIMETLPRDNTLLTILLNNINLVPLPVHDNIPNFSNNAFAIKWYNIYINKITNNRQMLGSWILCMWYDLKCKYSPHNLKCIVPFRLIILISALSINNNNNNIETNINNAYKPQLIEYIHQNHHTFEIINNAIAVVNDYNLIGNPAFILIIPIIPIGAGIAAAAGVLNYYDNTIFNYINLLLGSNNLGYINNISIASLKNSYDMAAGLVGNNAINVTLTNIHHLISHEHIVKLYFIILVSIIIIINSSPLDLALYHLPPPNIPHRLDPASVQNNIILPLLAVPGVLPGGPPLRTSQLDVNIIADLCRHVSYIHIKQLLSVVILNDPHLVEYYTYRLIEPIHATVINIFNTYPNDDILPGIIPLNNPYINDNNNFYIKLIKWVIFLLSNKNNIHELLYYTISDFNIVSIDQLNIDDTLKIIAKLLFIFFNVNNINIDIFSNPFYINEKNIYNKYKVNYKVHIDVICNIILNHYETLQNKPLKQTLSDTIYYLQKCYYDDIYKGNINMVNHNNFNNICTYNLRNKNRPANYEFEFLKDHQQPSEYSYYNTLINNEDPLNQNKFIISHMIGLYFEGILHKSHINNLNNFIDININKTIYKLRLNEIPNDEPAFLIVPPPPPPAPQFAPFFMGASHASNFWHIFIVPPLPLQPTTLLNNMLPLPFNHTIGWEQAGSIHRENFYNYYIINEFTNIGIINNNGIMNGLYSPPSNEFYYITLLNNINFYQTKILNIIINNTKNINNILEELKIGNITNLNFLFINYYPALLCINQIINNIKNSLIELYENAHSININGNPIELNSINIYNNLLLARNLNLINSFIYIYNYIYTPHKLLRLNKFNYYQIPVDINSLTSYVYINNNYDNNLLFNQDMDGISVLVPNIDLLYNNNNNNKLGTIFYDISSNFIKFLTFYNIFNQVRLSRKDNILPPSLLNNFDIFYKYIVILTIKNIITSIDDNMQVPNLLNPDLHNAKNEIYNNMLLYINNININNNITGYYYIAKQIEILIKEYINTQKNNAITNIFNNYILNNNINLDLNIEKLLVNNINLNLHNNEFILNENLNTLGGININIYTISEKIKHNKYFILYPNDLSNDILLKNKYYINININILNLLLKYNGNPYLLNKNNHTCFSNLLKFYYYIPLEQLKNNIDFDKLKIELNYIKNDYINNINKLLYNNDIFNNISDNLYTIINNLILSDNDFNNNIIKYIKESFYISSYLILHYLSYQFRLNNNTNIINMNEYLSLININYNDINKNYLFYNINNIPQDYNIIIYKNILDNLNEILIENNSRLNILNNNRILLIINNQQVFQILIDEINILQNYIININNNILYLQNLINIAPFINVVNPIENTDYNNFIANYDTNFYNNNIREGIHILYVWTELLKKPINNNYNLLPLIMLIKQKENLDKGLNKNELLIIKSFYKHISELAEDYFNNNDNNRLSSIINYILNYITKIIIGFNIVYMLQRLIFIYYYKSLNIPIAGKNAIINNKINAFMNTQLYGYNYSIKQYIYTIACPDFVKFVTNTNDTNKKTINEILKSICRLIDSNPIFIEENVKNEICKKLIKYFDNFTEKLIYLWYVNIENILKYFINNYRSIETIYNLL